MFAPGRYSVAMAKGDGNGAIAAWQIALTEPQHQNVLNVVDSLSIGEMNFVAGIENRTCGKMLDLLSHV